MEGVLRGGLSGARDHSGLAHVPGSLV